MEDSALSKLSGRQIAYATIEGWSYDRLAQTHIDEYWKWYEAHNEEPDCPEVGGPCILCGACYSYRPL